MWRSRGIRCDEQQIVVVNGSQQGIDLCARIFLDAGDPVVFEDPGYILARHAFGAIGARIVPFSGESSMSSSLQATDCLRSICNELLGFWYA